MESQPLPTTAAWPAPAGAMMAACAVERYEPGASRALFEHLYTQFERPIYRHIYRLLGNAEDARDCTQVAYAKAYLKLGETVAKGDFHPEAWLFRIATNVCRDELRRRRRVQWQDWDAYVSAFHPSQVAHDDPERDALQQETRREMDVVLRRLLPRHRTALILREYYDLSYEDVAREMGTTRAAVKAVLLRAREAFRDQYARAHPAAAHTTAGKTVATNAARASGPRVLPRAPAHALAA